MPGRGLKPDLTAHAIHGVLDDVQPHAAPRNLIYLSVCGEAGVKEPICELLFGELVHLSGGAPSSQQGLADGVEIDALAIIPQGELDRVPQMSRQDFHNSGDGLPRSLPLVRRLDAVVHGVADEMHQRLGQGV